MTGVELAVAAGALTAASTAAEGFGKYQEARAQSASMKENAAVLKRNAGRARLEGTLNEDRQRSNNKRELSKINSAMSEMGMDESSTAVGALAQEAADLEQKALDIRYGTETEAENYLYNAKMLERDAKLVKKQGRNAFYMSLLNGSAKGLNTYFSNKPAAGGNGSGESGGGGSSSGSGGGE